MSATKEQINRFLSDPDYLSLVELEREQRLLFITDISETRVSALLAWLFRPYEGHGLGDQAFRELLLSAWRRVQTEELAVSAEPPTPTRLLNRSFRELLVETEYQVEKPKGRGKGRAIDLLLVSRQHKLVVGVENKFGSTVHNEQLKAYREGLKKQFPDCELVLIYLDSNEENKPDDADWIPLSYQWIVTLIESRQRSGLLSARALDALTQFRDYLAGQGAMSDEREAERDRTVSAIAARHREVLDVFETFRRDAGSWHSRLRDISLTILEPLLVEYHQRWSLWNGVVEQSRHAQIKDAVRAHFGGKVEISSSPAEVFFRLRDWARFERTDAADWGGPRVSAWCGRGTRRTYDVWAGVSFEFVDQDWVAQLRVATSPLRENMKAPPQAAQWVRISRVNQLSPLKASERVIAELTRLDAAFQLLP